MAKRLPTRAAQYKYATTTVMTTERSNCATASKGRAYTLGRRGRFWEVRDPIGTLICLTVYKRGAAEVIRRLST